MIWSASLKLQHMEILNEELLSKSFRTGPADCGKNKHLNESNFTTMALLPQRIALQLCQGC